MSEPDPCVECGTTSSADYCPECGVRRNISRLTLKGAFAPIFEFDSPLLRTTRDLLIKPGVVASSWIDGQRRRYTNPIRYCVIGGVIFALGVQFGSSDGDDIPLVLEYLGFIALILIFPLSFITSWIMRLIGSKRSWLDWYALGAYVYGITVPLQLLFGLIQSWFGEYVSLVWLVQIGGFVPLIWFSFAAFGFTDRRWAALGLSIVAQLIWVTMLVGLQMMGVPMSA